MRPRESILFQASRGDARDVGGGLRPAIEKLAADRMADEADVGERDRIAATIASRHAVVRQMRFQRLVALDEPVPDPPQPRRLVQLELLLKKIANARNDQRMGVAG